MGGIRKRFALAFVLVAFWLARAGAVPGVAPDTRTPDPGTVHTPPPAAIQAVGAVDRDLREGWPVDLNTPSAGFPYTPTLFDIDGDGAAEIFLTGGNTFGLRGDGSFLPGWPTTEHLYMGYGTNEQKPGPSVADLEGDGDVEVLWSERDWWAGSAYMWCFNGREPGGANLPGFPQYAPDDYSNALDVPFVLGDSDGDGTLEAWGPHTLGNNFVHYRLSAFDHLGNRRFTRDLNPAENILDLYFGDLDADGDEEFFATTWLDPWIRLYVFTPTGGDAPGYPIPLRSFTGGYMPFGPPVPADLDGDGDLEFLMGYNAGTASTAYAQHHDGTPVAGFPFPIATGYQLLYLSLGDLTGDGEPELLAMENHLTGSYRVSTFNLDSGGMLWNYIVPTWPHGFPCVADVNGDGRQDVCVSTDGGQLLAIGGSDGLLLPGYPKTMAGASISGVAAGDIDGDGYFELVAATWDGLIYAWDTTGPAAPGHAEWPLRGVDARNTGIYRRGVLTAAPAAPSLACPLRVAPNPVRKAATFFATAGAAGMALDLFDVRGRRVDTLRLDAAGRGRWQPEPGLPAGVYLARLRGGPPLDARVVLLR